MSKADLAADVVLFACDQSADLGVPHVLLVERRWDPHAGAWALPGGYVESAETFEYAARRELFEETGVRAPARLDRVGVFDAPDRDPRGRVVSVAFVGQSNSMPVPVAADDAASARWVPVHDVLTGAARLAFDHTEIVTAAWAHVARTGWWSYP